MNIWTVANQKGGVGKTTTTVTLGGVLAANGSRTLLVDLDPHGSLTSYFGYDPDTLEESVFSLFHRKVERLRIPMASMLRKTDIPGLDLLPACTALITLDRQVSSLKGMGLVVHNALQSYRRYYQYVIIDCSPALGILMINALAACDVLIVPVQTEFLAIKGLERMLNTLKMVDLSVKHDIEYMVLPTMFDKRTRASRESLAYLQKHHEQHLWDGYIPVDTNFREASRLGRPLSIIAPKTRGASAYNSLLLSLQEKSQNLSLEYKEAV